MKLKQTPTQLLVLATAILAACGTTDRDWKLAKEANTAPGYADFLAKHPRGAHVDQARAAIEELDWSSTKAKNVIADYNRYLLTYPAGRHAIEAEAAVGAIEAVTYVPLNLPCGARVANMGFTFFGTPSGELVDFECQDKQGKTVKIKLQSKQFDDGKIQTEDFGVIRIRRPTANEVAAGQGGNALSFLYEITASDLKKLRTFLGLSADADQSSPQHPKPAKE